MKKGFIEFTHRSVSIRCGTRLGTSYTTKVLANVDHIVCVEEYECRMTGMEAVKSKIKVRDGASSSEFFSDLSVDEVKELIRSAS